MMEGPHTKTLVLGYHDVVRHKDFKSSGFQNPDANIYKVDRAAFSKHLEAIQLNPIRWWFLRKTGNVVLTFDDGGVSAVDVAKMIEPFGWRGYFFVTTDRIGSGGFLNETQILALRKSGHVIGSHSCSHPIRMACCTEEQLDREWSDSVRVLERILGEQVTIASLPGGYYSRKVAAAAARAGIRTLFISEPITSTQIVDGCLVVGRFTIQRGTSEQWVASLIAGDLWPRLQCYLFWNCKKLMKAIGGEVWLNLRYIILARRK
jgi:peptidoglycan/xylan/chitin deacetylase (PgdA/CDA1 family)